MKQNESGTRDGRYMDILRRVPDLRRSVEELADWEETPLDAIGLRVLSPVLFSYVLWILREAVRRGLGKLYFLARDGWIPCAIARALCQRRGIPVQCVYLYASRRALRMAACRFRDDTAYEKLFARSYFLSAQSLLERCGFSEAERRRVYREAAFPAQEETRRMGKREFAAFCQKVRQSPFFQTTLTEKSNAAYADTVAYLRQEGLLPSAAFPKPGETPAPAEAGLVDLGWTGSLQAALRRILDSEGVSITLTGFYLGMLEPPPQRGDSVYLTWLFDSGAAAVHAWFAQNPLECLCGAPHGTTLGYRQKENAVAPVLDECENPPELPRRLAQIALKFAARCPAAYSPAQRPVCLKLLRTWMFRPSMEEARAMAPFRFRDDVAGAYRPLLRTAERREFRRELLPFRLLCRDSTDGLYWYCGSLALSGPFPAACFRYGYFLSRLAAAWMKQGRRRIRQSKAQSKRRTDKTAAQRNHGGSNRPCAWR